MLKYEDIKPLMWTDTNRYNQLLKQFEKQEQDKDFDSKGMELMAEYFPDFSEETEVSYAEMAELLARVFYAGKDD